MNDAQHFLATINNVGGLVSSDRLMLDFESVAWSNSGMWGVAHAYAISFFNELRSLVGPAQPMLIYSYHDYEQNSHVVRSDLPSVGLVIAAYGSGYTLPDGWDHACVWQFTDGKVGQVTYFPGIGTCDANRQLCDLHDCIEGDEDELTPDDKAWLESTIKQAVSDGVKAELTFLIGTRTTPADKPAGPPTISNVADALYLMSHGDATHPWSLTGISASVADTQSRIANLQTGQVDPAAVKAAVAGLKVTGVLSE